MKKLTHKRLLEMLSYDPETGEFRWIEKKYGRKVGQIAGWVNTQRYRAICIDGDTYLAHRLAWFYMAGEWPVRDIDHINHDRTDNRLSNLREAGLTANNQNRQIPHNSPLGIPGVRPNNNGTKFRVQIGANNTTLYLGTYDDFFGACCVRKSAENKYGYHANHGNRG